MAMDITKFDESFNSLVVDALSNYGFRSHGKSVYFMDDIHTVCMIRLGGRRARRGSIAYLICCRHSYLPNMEEKVPTKFESEVQSYPLKLEPGLVKMDNANLNISYAKNFNYGNEVFTYEDKDDSEIEIFLEELVAEILAVKKWFTSQPESNLAKQISMSLNRAWVEKIWLEAYERHGAI